MKMELIVCTTFSSCPLIGNLWIGFANTNFLDRNSITGNLHVENGTVCSNIILVTVKKVIFGAMKDAIKHGMATFFTKRFYG